MSCCVRTDRVDTEAGIVAGRARRRKNGQILSRSDGAEVGEAQAEIIRDWRDINV